MAPKENEIIIDILCEFFEVAVHNILHTRKLYPDGIFEKRKKYGVVVYQSVHPQLNEYITESLKAIRYHAKANQLRRLFVCTTGPGVVYERFVFDVVHLKNSFESDPIYLKLEQNLRDLCLKLQTSCSFLESLPEDASFRIMLHTTDYSDSSLNDDPTYDNFPWIHVSENECKISVPEIVPLHTVDTDSVGLQIYVEKNTND